MEIDNRGRNVGKEEELNWGRKRGGFKRAVSRPKRDVSRCNFNGVNGGLEIEYLTRGGIEMYRSSCKMADGVRTCRLWDLSSRLSLCSR